VAESVLWRADYPLIGVGDFKRRPRVRTPFGGLVLAGTELVAWRDAGGRLIVGPGACPHLGACALPCRCDAEPVCGDC
jgi:hypothetical protein